MHKLIQFLDFNPKLRVPRSICKKMSLQFISTKYLKRNISFKLQGTRFQYYVPYFPAHKTHFFPRKMWPKFDLHLMRRG